MKERGPKGIDFNRVAAVREVVDYNQPEDTFFAFIRPPGVGDEKPLLYCPETNVPYFQVRGKRVAPQIVMITPATFFNLRTRLEATAGRRR